MIFKITKAIIYLTLITSKSAFSFNVSLIQSFPFPGCEDTNSSTWCNLWGSKKNYSIPLNDTDLLACYNDQNCCPSNETKTHFSVCEEYDSPLATLLSELAIGAGGAMLIFLGSKDAYKQARKVLEFFGSVLVTGGVSGIISGFSYLAYLGFQTNYYAPVSRSSVKNISIYCSSIAGVAGGTLWYINHKLTQRDLRVHNQSTPVMANSNP